jgi:DNA-binding CsgD family transcriptional regulator/tetratricopeptide (TPR) repeat protein
LSVPRQTDSVALSELDRYDAIRLFLERAQAVSPEFLFTADDAATVAEICRRTDGLPLAVELAAARLRHLSPRALLARLERRLPLLTGGARDLPPRQQALRETIAWSYGLLEPAEQRVFRHLAVFVDGLTLEAAEVVCNGVDDIDVDVFESLTGLVDQSLLLPDASDSPRFRLLETVREYSQEQLAASGEHVEAADRHLAFYLALAEEAEPHLRASHQAVWLDRLEAEHANLRAGLVWALARGANDLALRLAGSLWRFWFFRGHFTEGRHWLEAALFASDPTCSLARAKALCGAGMLAHYQADYARAEALCTESLALYRQLDDQLGVASALNGLAIVARSMGDFGTVRARYAEALVLLRTLDNAAVLGNTLVYFGYAMLIEGDMEFARMLIQEGHAAYQAVQDSSGIAFAVHAAGVLAWYDNDYLTAQRRVEKGLETFRGVGDQRSVARSLGNLGNIALGLGDHGTAAARYSEALVLFRTLGDTLFIANTLEGVVALCIATGQPRRGANLLGACDMMRERISAPVTPIEKPRLERMRADVRAQLGEPAYVSAWTDGRSMTTEQAIAAAFADSGTDGWNTQPATVKRNGSSPAADLTPREIEVLRLVAAGHTNAGIAGQLVISERTVNTHLVSIFDKLGVHTRAAATRFAVEHQLA